MAPTTVKKAKAPVAHKTTVAKKVVAKKVVAKKAAPGHDTSVRARTADLSENVLKSVEAAERSAIEAVRKFVDTVDEVLPAIGEHPSRRENVIDAALDMADKLVTTQYDFLRGVVRNADRSLKKTSKKAPSLSSHR